MSYSFHDFPVGAAKFRKLLQRLKPRITIVEEAAEVLESHIVTSLTSGCQHLILIGDHQQLRPNPTVFELAKHYNLDVSLFERMVKNGMPFERLRLQHRMRPEISKMLDHIYSNPKLENHESVLNFENIKGVNRNMYFVDHDESEVGSQNAIPPKSVAITSISILPALCKGRGYRAQKKPPGQW